MTSVSCRGGVFRPSRVTSKCASWRYSATLAETVTAIAAHTIRALAIHADTRDPRPRNGSRSASMNSASKLSHHATNRRLFEMPSPNPAKPSTPKTTAPTTSAATTRSDRATRDISCSLPSRECPHSQKQRHQRDAEKEAHVRKIDRADRKRAEMHCKGEIHYQRVRWAWQQPSEIVDDPQYQKDAERDQRGDHLIGRECRRQQSRADQRGTKNQQAKIATIDRSNIGVAEISQHHRVAAR